MVSSNDIYAITQNVFTTMIDSRVSIEEQDRLTIDQHPIAGFVQIAGKWTGAVLVQTTRELAARLAEKMLALEGKVADSIDCHDSIAELTNMIGGNIKGLVPGPCVLSLPCVTSGPDFDMHALDADTESSLSMSCEGQFLRVVLFCGKKSASLPTGTERC